MNALESPVEAQAFHYLSYSFLAAVGSVWTWITAVTAAVSVWRIRFPSHRRSRIQIFPDSPPLLANATEIGNVRSGNESMSCCAAREVLNSGEIENVRLGTETTSCCVVEREGSTKVKFTLYYEEEEDYRIEEDDSSCENEDEVNEVRCDFDLGRDMDIRMGDLGFYRYQDLTVLDGNVVRLWEDDRRRYGGGLRWRRRFVLGRKI